MARAKVSVSLDPKLLGAVDAFVESNPGQDRSKVIDQALQQWYARLQESAMEDQFGRPDPANSAEHTSWRAIRRAAAARRLKRS
jgi:Arc/MetJ-type ribon-helix-helix transcriptional regulator